MLNKGISFSIVLIFTALSMLGWFTLPLLPVKLQPDYGLSSFEIDLTWQGTSPQIMETEVTSKIEGAVANISGIENISSVSYTGRAVITVNINKYADADQLRLEISELLRRIFPLLPQGVEYPVLTRSLPGDENISPLLTFSLYGSCNSYDLQQYARNNIVPVLSMIEGVDKINVYGGSEYIWQIIYNPSKLQTFGISPAELKNAVGSFFIQKPLGRIIETKGDIRNEFFVKLNATTNKQVVWRNIPVKKVADKIIYLKDIANVKKILQKARSYYRINGKNTVNIVLYAGNKSNAIRLADEVKSRMSLISDNLPESYRVELSYNSVTFVKSELDKIIKRTVLTLLILLLFVFISSMDIRYVLLIFLSLFTNISLSFILYYLSGVELHLYSLAGITVSLGLIIDNAIVMSDHLIYRKNRKVFTALLASTLTTMASLGAIWLLPGNIKLNLWDFATIIVINLAVSLLVSLFYIPALFVLIMTLKLRKKRNFKKLKTIVRLNRIYLNLISKLLKFRIVALALLIWGFGIPLYLLPQKMDSHGLTASIYNKTFGSKWYNDNLKSSINKYLGGSLRLFSYYVFENSYYPNPIETKLFVLASMPKGATAEQLNDVFLELENYLGLFADKIKYHTKISGAQYGSITIYFKKNYDDKTFPHFLKSMLIARTIELGGINWNIYGVGKGFVNRAGVNEIKNFKAMIKGYSYNELENIALLLKQKLSKNPRVKKINISSGKNWWDSGKSYEFFALLNRENMNFYKKNFSDIYNALKANAVDTRNGFRILTRNSPMYIDFKSAYSFNTDKWNILNMPFDTTGFKLKYFVTISKDFEQQAIYKENQNYLRFVDFLYAGNEKFGNNYLDKVIKEINTTLPIGYSIEKVKQDYFLNPEESISYLKLIILIVVVIFVICSILFESLSQPFTIILTVPASIIGAFLTFYLFNFNFDQGGYASFILIAGLVVNSSIYILNEFNNLKKRNKKRNTIALYIKAFNYKIVPVLLTIMSTVLGLLPFVLYGRTETFWFALAVGTMGGLLFSILIIVVYLPLFTLKAKDK